MKKDNYIDARYKLQHYVSETGHWNDLEEYKVGDFVKAMADFDFHQERRPNERCRLVIIKTYVVAWSGDDK